MIGRSTLLKQELYKIDIMKELMGITRNTLYINSNKEFLYNVFIATVKKRKGIYCVILKPFFFFSYILLFSSVIALGFLFKTIYFFF